MAGLSRHGNEDRIKAGIGVASLHALLFYALLTGLGGQTIRHTADSLNIFDVPQDPPPPPEEEPIPVERSKAPEGAAAPPNLRSRPSPVVAPTPRVRLEVASPVRTAPLPAPLPTGSDRTAGAADAAGPGTGAGGQGSGTGSGRFGSGAGGGGITRAQRIAGALSYADYPGAGREEIETVSVRFMVGPDGRVGGCAVTRSSGNARLDATTCRLIEQQFRYRPATVGGEPVASVVNTTFDWVPPARRRR